MKWVRLKSIVTRNWREKVLALGLAFLLWFMIKFQATQRSFIPQSTERPAKASRL